MILVGDSKIYHLLPRHESLINHIICMQTDLSYAKRKNLCTRTLTKTSR